ncbi:hypothetical protein [Actinotalea fermentans]|uniref:Uncharacterized protein n=1 Tax=Actinotalea fermentans TaxID=43671 RepID=A0A511YZ75_9CELL|nr:hypothetical protein [Actinotalea fermentans]GEN80501.1 hypothetical protein AFE02nite_22350 [Actinotalea fermentans]
MNRTGDLARLLASSGDPEVLVPGSLNALYGDADALVRQSGELTALADDVRRRTVGTWFGAGAARWAELRPVLADNVDAAAAVYLVAADALRAQAAVLIRGRAVALIAARLWQEAIRAETMASPDLVCAPPRLSLPAAAPRIGVPAGASVAVPGRRASFPAAGGPDHDPTGLRALATRVLALAHDGVARHAADVAALLDSLCKDLPDGEFRLSSLVGGIGHWVKTNTLMWATTHPLRWVVDFEGTLADANAMVDGVEETVRTLAADPHEANRLLLDSQLWHDDPGRWIGQALPDAALTVAGLGPTTRAMRRLEALTVAAERRLPWPRPRPEPRTFTSTDPLVGETATMLDHVLPGVVKGVNQGVPTLYGRSQEIDILLERIAIEVKSGRAQKVAAQLDAIASKTGLTPLLYAPDLPNVARAGLLMEGRLVARNFDELLQILREFM